MSEGVDDVPEVVSVFSKRAKLVVPKISSEEFQAATKLLEEIQVKECPLTEDIQHVPPKKRGRKKASAKNEKKCVDPVQITLEDDVQTVPSNSEICLSAAAKRRLRKFQKEREKELKSMDEANQKVLSCLCTSDITDIEEVHVDSFNKVILLTISYLSEISRLKCNKDEKFSTIFPKVADLFKLNVTEFLLCLRDQNIKTDDTPESLNIVETDILECIPYKDEGKTAAEYDEDQLQLFFQVSDSKAKSEMFVHKLAKMQEVMEKYSKSRDIPLNQLVFEFDGEKISGTETPEDLDMESGNCVDVTVLDAKDIQTRKGSKTKKNDITVVTINSDSNDSDVILCG